MQGFLVFQTDFTYKEGAVGAMYGVVKSVDPSLELIDLTHEIPKFDTWSASYRLHQVLDFWPRGTVFVSVVDPGVGTRRRASVARTRSGHYIVSPDNGSLTHLAPVLEEIREIDPRVNRLPGKGTEGVSIFHGRDLFSYCAARLASGKISYEQVGPAYPLEELVLHPIHEAEFSEGRVAGIFEISDPNFGNLWTNIPTGAFQEAGFAYGDQVHCQIFHGADLLVDRDLPFFASFGEVEKGQVLIYNNELSRLGLAVNQGSLMDDYQLGYGADWSIILEKKKGE